MFYFFIYHNNEVKNKTYNMPTIERLWIKINYEKTKSEGKMK